MIKRRENIFIPYGDLDKQVYRLDENHLVTKNEVIEVINETLS